MRHWLAQVEHGLVGEVGYRGEACDRRQRGARARGDDEVLRGDPPPADFDGVGRDEAGAPGDDVDAHAAKAFRTVVRRDAADHLGDALHHPREIGAGIGR